MIANNRKINDLKNDIAYKMEREFYISDMFMAHVDGGMIRGEDMLEDFIKVGRCPELRDMITRLSKDEIMSNPYLQDINVPRVSINNIDLGRKRFLPANTIMVYQEKSRDLDTLMPINSYFICDQPLRLPAIVEGSTSACWMSVEPLEITSFQKFIDEAKGHVCLCGCGLGYVAYMLSIKEDVESITIVELNSDIISIFEIYILPQFKNKTKIQVVERDAIEYLSNTNLSRFDYINVDIWRDTLDMLPLYLPCLVVESKYPDVNFSYWIEPTLKDLFRRSILEQFSGYSNEISECFTFANAIAKDILDNSNINTKQDLKDLIKLDDMRDILRHWYLSNPHLFTEYQRQSNKKMQETLQFLEKNHLNGGSFKGDIKTLNKLFNDKIL